MPSCHHVTLRHQLFCTSIYTIYTIYTIFTIHLSVSYLVGNSKRILGGCSLTLSTGAKLVPRSPSLSADLIPVGSTPDQPFCVASVDADDVLHVLEGRGLSGSHRRAQHAVGLRAGLPLSSHSPPQEGSWSCQGEPFSLSLHIGRPRLCSPVSKRFESWKSVVSPSTMNLSSTSRRESPLRLWSSSFLLLGRSWGVDAVSDRSFRLIAAGWIQSSEDRYVLSTKY
jgi:hypothetical protein